MNYKKIYDSLIKKRQEEILTTGYYETHHIIPRCMGGNNSKENLVKLTAKEHYIAHALLFHIYKTPKMAFAWMCMCRISAEQQRNITAKQYELARTFLTDTMKKSMIGENNPFYGKTHSEETKKKISDALKKRKVPKSKKQLESWIEKVAKKPKTIEHRNKISRKGYIMLKNCITKESIRIKKEEKEKYDENVWKNPAQISQKKEICLYCGIETIAGLIKRFHNENCKHKKT